MVFVRVFLAWMLLLALPLQAFSAVSMRVCGAGMSRMVASEARGAGHAAFAAVKAGGAMASSAGATHPSPMGAAVPSRLTQGGNVDCGACASPSCHGYAAQDPHRSHAGPLDGAVPQLIAASVRTRSETPPRKPPRS